MERRKVRRRDADLFVEDETELFRDALRAGQTQKVKEMLAEVAEEDASVWCREPLDVYGRRALHHAMMAPHEAQMQLIRLLVSGRADPNAGDEEGIAPLHLAAQRASKFTIRTLLCARADNQQRSRDGRSTVDFVQLNPLPVEIFEVLGWPGKGPRQNPLDRNDASASEKPSTLEQHPPVEAEESGWSQLLLPLMAALLWFSFLGLVSYLVIYYI
ncbi:unnamed protein product [Cladocopium goreaui]|uniref:Uncharacterized protein n=1 Tax=Cladocopium goreaui TaxID=2562237 RepID=A0A9P1CWQ5_9DINO|nr:unnamed protein product [Cladocopium goreaui]